MLLSQVIHFIPRMAVKVMPMPPRMATGMMGTMGKRVLVVWPMR